MIEIPENLAPELIPVAWLCGQWQGWGISEVPELLKRPIAALNLVDEPLTPTLIWQETSFWPEGKHLAQKTMIYRAEPKTTAPEMMDDAPTGLSKLRRGTLLWREDHLWRVQVWSPAEGEQPAQARLLAQAQGGPYGGNWHWEAQTLGPRMMAQAVTDPEITETTPPEEISMPENAAPVEQKIKPVRSERMHGLVGGELFWSQDSELPAGNRIVDFSGRMMRYTAETIDQ